MKRGCTGIGRGCVYISDIPALVCRPSFWSTCSQYTTTAIVGVHVTLHGRQYLHTCIFTYFRICAAILRGNRENVQRGLSNTKHSWQNGTRCRDGVNVLWCRSYLVWLVFEGSIPTCTGFHLENFFVTCTCTRKEC